MRQALINAMCPKIFCRKFFDFSLKFFKTRGFILRAILRWPGHSSLVHPLRIFRNLHEGEHPCIFQSSYKIMETAPFNRIKAMNFSGSKVCT